MRTLITTMVIMLIMAPAMLNAGETCTVPPIKISDLMGPGAKIDKINEALKNYVSHEPPFLSSNNRYEICFEMNEPLNINEETLPQIQFKSDEHDTSPVLIKGLKVKLSEGVDPGQAKSLLAVIKGGSAPVKLTQSSFEGNATASGKCIDLRGENVELDNVMVKGCREGIHIAAPNANITNSEITGNGIGIRVADGVAGAKVLRSRVYANTENIVTLEEASSPIFFDGETSDTLDIFPVEVGAEAVIDYADRPVYINIPLNGGAASEEDVTVEFFLTTEIEGDAYELVNKDSIDIVKPAKEIANEPARYRIPAEHLNKPLVAIFTHPVLGTTGFSQQFKTAAGDVVTFVSSPFDMPTSGMDGASGSGEDVEVGSGGSDVVGGTVGAAGAKGCGGQLAPGGAARTVDVAMSLWWIILAGALLGSARLATSRIRQNH